MTTINFVQPERVGNKTVLAQRLDVLGVSRGGLEIVVDRAGEYGAVSLRLAGELDFACAALVEAVCSNHAAAFAGRTVRIDMSRVTFCDCAGLRALITARDRQAKSGGALVLRGLTRPVTRLVHLADLDDRLEVEDVADCAPVFTSVEFVPPTADLQAAR